MEEKIRRPRQVRLVGEDYRTWVKLTQGRVYLVGSDEMCGLRVEEDPSLDCCLVVVVEPGRVLVAAIHALCGAFLGSERMEDGQDGSTSVVYYQVDPGDEIFLGGDPSYYKNPVPKLVFE